MTDYSAINQPLPSTQLTGSLGIATYSSGLLPTLLTSSIGPTSLINPAPSSLTFGPKVFTFIMKAKVIASGAYIRWTVYGTPDNSAIYAPTAANLLTDIGIDSVL